VYWAADARHRFQGPQALAEPELRQLEAAVREG
jgi:hypothetical protein